MTQKTHREYCIILQKLADGRVDTMRYVENGKVDPPKPIDEIGRKFYASSIETARKLLAEKEHIEIIWDINGSLTS